MNVDFNTDCASVFHHISASTSQLWRGCGAARLSQPKLAIGFPSSCFGRGRDRTLNNGNNAITAPGTE